jgi:N,N'-diacetyllegionaminate synthase
MSTPFDEEAADFLEELGMNIFKIASGEITNKPLIQHIARKGKPMILSTGMSYLEEVGKAIDWIKEVNHSLYSSNTHSPIPLLTVLHCNTEYPTPFEDVNLLAMLTLKDTFKINVGYSDHTQGIEVPVAAVALGAKVIEKHFTLDRNMPGPDHRASLEPHELKSMVLAIRNIERAMGDGIKKPSPSEFKNREIARKSIVAAKEIKKGEPFSEDNLTAKRPGTGISPMEWDRIMGRAAIRDFKKDELIEV